MTPQPSAPLVSAAARRLSGAFLGAAREKSVVDRYWSDPVLWAEECIAWPGAERLAPYQAELLRALVEDGRVASRGPRGYGKSAVNALVACWFATTRELRGCSWKIVSTAGAWSQLEDFLWPEVHLWARRIRWDVLGLEPWRDGRDLLSLSIQGKHGAATAANPKISPRIEGGHAEQFLYIFDEAKLIPAETWNSAEGSASSTVGTRELRWLAQSSGGDADGRFFELHSGKFPRWRTRHVTLEEAIAAGRVSKTWAEDLGRDFGTDSPIYQNHALGNFVRSGGTNSVIRISDVERAFERWREWQRSGTSFEQTTLGVDVGTGNLDRDPATIATRCGPIITEVEMLHFAEKHPEMALAGIVAARLRAGGVAVVDGIGQGSGVVSRLDETARGKTVAFVASAASNERDRSGAYGFLNLRAEAWWQLREWLADPMCDLALPEDPRTLGELTLPTWTPTSGSKIQIEGKLDIARRLRKIQSHRDEGGSTNRADAIVMACWAGARRSSVSLTSANVANEPHLYHDAGHDDDEPSWGDEV